MARGFDDVETSGGGTFKPADYADVAAVMVAVKSMEVTRSLKWEARSRGLSASDPANCQNQIRTVADIHVFRSFSDAEKGEASEVLENINIYKTGLASPFARIAWQKGADGGNEPASVMLKPNVVGSVSAPVRVVKNDRGAWMFVPVPRDAKGFAGMLSYREALPDPEIPVEVEDLTVVEPVATQLPVVASQYAGVEVPF